MHSLEILHALNAKYDRHCTTCLRPYTEENAYTIVKKYTLEFSGLHIQLCGKCASIAAQTIHLHEVQ